jgi:hypothetical protein
VYLDSITVRMGPGNLVAFGRITYTYSGTNRGYATKTEATYKPNPSRLVTVSRVTNTYYPDGKVQTMSYEGSFSGGTLLPSGTDSFGYTPGVAGYTYRRQQDANPVTGYNYFTNTVHINAANQKDSVTFSAYQGTTLQDISSTAIVYNAAGLPVTRKDYNVHINPGLYGVEHYYYENNGVGVQQLTKLAVTISPNPTTGIIRIHYPADVKAGSTMSVSIANAAGQLVHTESFPMLGASQQIILGAEVPAGQYYITVDDHSGRIPSVQSILKL